MSEPPVAQEEPSLPDPRPATTITLDPATFEDPDAGTSPESAPRYTDPLAAERRSPGWVLALVFLVASVVVGILASCGIAAVRAIAEGP